MKTSEQTELLFKALSAAQADAQNAVFDSTNPHFRSKYASLAQIVDTLRPICAQHGLGVLFMPCFREDKGHVILTRLFHSSGQWIEDEMVLSPIKLDPQGIGSAITYAKRQILPGLFLIASEEDDDANAASYPPTVTPKQANEATITGVLEHIAGLSSEGAIRAYYPIAKATLNVINNSPLKERLDHACKERIAKIKINNANEGMASVVDIDK